PSSASEIRTRTPRAHAWPAASKPPLPLERNDPGSLAAELRKGQGASAGDVLATVDVDHAAGHPGGAGAGEVDQAAGDVLGRGQAARGVARARPVDDRVVARDLAQRRRVG